MATGTLACFAHAFRLLLRRTALWWPGCLVDAALFVITLGWLKAMLLGYPLAWPVAGWLLTAVVWVAWDAARWFAVDRALRGEVIGFEHLLAGLRRRGAAWVGGALLLGLAQALAAVAGLVAFLHLLCAGDWSRLAAPTGLVDGWRVRGVVWLVGGVTVIALLGALRTVLRWAAEWWRVALLAETPRPREAMAAAVRFVARQRWAMSGRWFCRQIIGAAVWLTPWVTVGLLVDVAHRFEWELTIPLRVFWVCATALAWALARTWVILADQVAWRRRGGADGDRELLTVAVGEPRPRWPRPPGHQGEQRLASEPAGRAISPGRLASEPGELGLLFDEG